MGGQGRESRRDADQPGGAVPGVGQVSGDGESVHVTTERLPRRSSFRQERRRQRGRVRSPRQELCANRHRLGRAVFLSPDFIFKCFSSSSFSSSSGKARVEVVGREEYQARRYFDVWKTDEDRRKSLLRALNTKTKKDMHSRPSRLPSSPF